MPLVRAEKFIEYASGKSNDAVPKVQEELVTQIIKDLVDQIFNATVANW